MILALIAIFAILFFLLFLSIIALFKLFFINKSISLGISKLSNSLLFTYNKKRRRYNLRLNLSNKKRLRGYVLLSQAVAHQVPSALKSLTSVFGMGTGVSSLL